MHGAYGVSGILESRSPSRACCVCIRVCIGRVTDYMLPGPKVAQVLAFIAVLQGKVLPRPEPGSGFRVDLHCCVEGELARKSAP